MAETILRMPWNFRGLWRISPSAGTEKVPPAAPEPAATIVTVADDTYWRCLYQFLKSAERREFAKLNRFVVFDLGLSNAHRELLRTRFTWAMFCNFPRWHDVLVGLRDRFESVRHFARATQSGM